MEVGISIPRGGTIMSQRPELSEDKWHFSQNQKNSSMLTKCKMEKEQDEARELGKGSKPRRTL